MKPPITLAGDMNERITLQTATSTPDASGGFAVAWNDTATLWAMVTPLSAGEKWQHGQLGAVSAYRFTIRRRADLDGTLNAAQRLVWRNAALNIRAITRNPNRQVTDIVADSGEAT